MTTVSGVRGGKAGKSTQVYVEAWPDKFAEKV
jgi:hypothetical protein